uniref:uncharacterized protein LOC109954678 isoform X3 n=1 Tax=Monopterus albus TaxID=43700 RepID=UPI0009B41D0A|nr:uncharacterized protein LOC109954678 isoform X3 [Monopterus albus]
MPVCPLVFAAALCAAVQAVSPVPTVPDHVQALVGSCVVIPCSFTPLAPHPLKGRKERVYVRLRFRGGGYLFPLRSIAFNSKDRAQVSRDFRGRASLFGRITDGDCSVKIERISQDDSRMFEIALNRVPPKEVKVQVQSMNVQEGASALLVCSCKADPPASAYRWSYSQCGHTIHLQQHTHTVRVYNVTRDMRVRCSAQNPIGRGDSLPTLLNIQYKPAIHQLSSNCVVEELEVVCHCSVDSNPKPAVTWSVNGTVPPHDYNISVTSKSHMLTATLRGHMDTPLTVICFAFNALGNDSLVLLQEEDKTPVLWLVIPAVGICLAIFLLSIIFYCCRKRAGKGALSRHLAVYPEGLGIYQDRMPLYINCTEVTHIYTNGSYQLVYQNCTPLFVHSKQIRPMGRRGGERRRRGEGGGIDRQASLGSRGTREVQSTAAADAETAIYLEIL